MARRGLDAAPCARQRTELALVDLRAAPGLVAAAAGDGASVLRLLGLPGHRLLRAQQPLRHAAGLHVLRRAPAPARHWRDPRLGAVALPERRTRPRALRRHAPVRTRRPAPGISSGVEELHF